MVGRVWLQEQTLRLHLLPAFFGLLLLQPVRLPGHLLLPPVSASIQLLQQLPSLPVLSI